MKRESKLISILLTIIGNITFLCSCSTSNKPEEESVEILFDSYITDTSYLKSILDPTMPSGYQIQSIGYDKFQNDYMRVLIVNNTKEPIYLLGKSYANYPIDTLFSESIRIVGVSDDRKNFFKPRSQPLQILENLNGFNYEIPGLSNRRKVIAFGLPKKHKYYKLEFTYSVRNSVDSLVEKNSEFIIGQ